MNIPHGYRSALHQLLSRAGRGLLDGLLASSLSQAC
jgi:hypothetical protein